MAIKKILVLGDAKMDGDQGGAEKVGEHIRDALTGGQPPVPQLVVATFPTGGDNRPTLNDIVTERLAEVEDPQAIAKGTKEEVAFVFAKVGNDDEGYNLLRILSQFDDRLQDTPVTVIAGTGVDEDLFGGYVLDDEVEGDEDFLPIHIKNLVGEAVANRMGEMDAKRELFQLLVCEVGIVEERLTQELAELRQLFPTAEEDMDEDLRLLCEDAHEIFGEMESGLERMRIMTTSKVGDPSALKGAMLADAIKGEEVRHFFNNVAAVFVSNAEYLFRDLENPTNPAIQFEGVERAREILAGFAPIIKRLSRVAKSSSAAERREVSWKTLVRQLQVQEPETTEES